MRYASPTFYPRLRVNLGVPCMASQSTLEIACADRRPLAERLRPTSLAEFVGLEAIPPHIVKSYQGDGGLPSLVLWGPPGCGKTTLAKLLGSTARAHFEQLSAVLSGVKDVREVIETAKARLGMRTILFVDEIHRFNKAQQDAFLPHVENGTVVFIGATTENPSFYLTPALRSRVKVVTLPALAVNDLRKLAERGASHLGIALEPQAMEALGEFVGGDARRLLNLLEELGNERGARQEEVSLEELKAFVGARGFAYDRDGEEHYNLASAFIKSLRGSDADGALYWGFRMLEAGEDPRFLCRRMMIFASEDIGNSDPRALSLAVATGEAFDRLGLPEGRIPLAQCITYLATAPKSNRSYAAMHKALAAVEAHTHAAVPLHLRNAPTKLMKELGYGEDYQYPHDASEGYIPGTSYLPSEVRGTPFYEPSPHGYEKTIGERMHYRRNLAKPPGSPSGTGHQ